MNVVARYVVVSVVLGVMAPGCAVQTASPAEDTADTAQAIAGGRPIYDTGDVISTEFPKSTVWIQMNDGSACTGETLSNTQILTAAHCVPAGSCVVGACQYPTTASKTASACTFAPTLTSCPTASPWSTSVRPPGVTGNPDSTGDTNFTDTSGDFADLAIVTLASPLLFPATAVLPGVPGSFPGMVSEKVSMWEVGTGDHNVAGDNASATMYWVPVTSAVPDDTGGKFNVRPTLGTTAPCQHGDSGGPVYTKFFSGLILVGVCHASVAALGSSFFTSVLWLNNRNWISKNYVAPPTPSLVRLERNLIDPYLGVFESASTNEASSALRKWSDGTPDAPAPAAPH